MEKELKEKLRKTISECETIRYVYISKKDGFFLFWLNPFDFVNFGIEETEIDAKCSSEHWNLPAVCDTVTPHDITFPYILILHDNKLITNEEKKRAYFFKYGNKMHVAPSFSRDNICGNKEVKINSKKFITPIRDLFREVGLLSELRGKGKTKSKKNQIRDKFFIDGYRELRRRKINSQDRVRILLKQWEAWVNKKFPEDVEEAEEWYCSEATARRSLKNVIKK